MTTNYVINLVNQSATTQTFWCFLARPDELASDPNVFANSSTSLAVAANAPGTNTFTIPVQYVVGAGASNNAVGLDIRIDSSITQNTETGKAWMANYATVPPNMGPTLNPNGTSSGSTLAISSNKFDQVNNEANAWFASMSFGIQTQQGFIGMSWSPSPQTTRTLTPKLKFYIATGTFGSNKLADWTTVSTSSAEISAPGDFQYGQTTVTLTSDGSWQVTPGKPSSLLWSSSGPVSRLIDSHTALTQAHVQLVLAASYSGSPVTAPAPRVEDEKEQLDTVSSVQWDTELEDVGGGITLVGTLTVRAALAASFTFFVLSGTKFSISRAPVGGTTINFSYSGTRSAQNVKSLFTAGAPLLLGNDRLSA